MSTPVPTQSTMNLYHEMIKDQKEKADQIKNTINVIAEKEKKGTDATALRAHLADLQYSNKSLLLQISIEEKDFQKLDATPERSALNELEHAYKRHGISSFKQPVNLLPFYDSQSTEPIDVDETTDPRAVQLPVTPMRMNTLINKVIHDTTNSNDLRSHPRSPGPSSDESALKKPKAIVEAGSQISTSTKRKISWSAAVRTPTKPALAHTLTPVGNLVL
jgi:hypothetical protein